MATRANRLRKFVASQFEDARPQHDDGLRHLRFEYGSHLVCGPLAWPLSASEAKGRLDCPKCAAGLAARAS